MKGINVARPPAIKLGALIDARFSDKEPGPRDGFLPRWHVSNAIRDELLSRFPRYHYEYYCYYYHDLVTPHTTTY